MLFLIEYFKLSNERKTPYFEDGDDRLAEGIPVVQRVSQNFNSSFLCFEFVIPAKAGIQRQRWISAFPGMTRPGGHRAVWFWWRVSGIPAFAGMTRMKPGMRGVNSFPRWREFCDTLFTAGRMLKMGLKHWADSVCTIVSAVRRQFIGSAAKVVSQKNMQGLHRLIMTG